MDDELDLAPYLGRLTDVAAFHDPSPRAAASRQLQMRMVTEVQGGHLLAGVRKVAQRAIIRLLTPRGSMRHLPDEGTEFLDRLRHGEIRTPTDLAAAFASAALDVITQEAEERLASDPADEQLTEMRLETVVLQGRQAALRVRFVTAAGASRVDLIPIPVTV